MTDLITDKIVLWFIGIVLIISVLMGVYFLTTLLQMQSQHETLQEKANEDVQGIKNLTDLIVTNQHIILNNQETIQNISTVIDEHLDSMSFSPENNVLLKQMLPLIMNLTRSS